MSAAAMKPSEALRNARELITPDGSWTQQFFAKKANGEYTSSYADDATCFCSLGAINRACEGAIGFKLLEEPVLYLRMVIRNSVSEWNDAPDRTHTEVLDAFDRAIALAEAEGR